MKKTLAICAFVSVLLLLALWVVPRFINVNRYKADIVDLLDKNSGLDFAINGDIGLSFLPNLSVTIEKISVDGKKNPQYSNLGLDIKSLELHLKLFSLFKNKIEFSAIDVNHPVLKVSQQLQPGIEVKAKNNRTIDAVAKPKSKYALKITDFRVVDGVINIDNGQDKDPLVLKKIEVRSSIDGNNIPFKLSSDLYLAKQQQLPLELNGNLVLNNNNFSSDLSFKLQDTKGFGKIEANLASAIPELTISLNIDHLDIDKLTSKSDNNTKSQSDKSDKNQVFAWSKEKLPLSFINKISGHVNISIAEANYKKLLFKTIISNNHFSYGKLTSDTNLTLFGGNIGTNSSIDISTTTPALSFNLILDKLNSSQVLKELSGNDKFSGTINGSLEVHSTGDNLYQIVNNLEGKGKSNIDKGSFKGVNLVQMISNVTSAFESVGSTSNVTDFEQIKASFLINKGVVHNEDLTIKSSGLEMLGKGSVNLSNMTVAYQLTPSISTKNLNSLGNKITIPVKITGSVFKPYFSPDLESKIMDIVKDPSKAADVLNGLKGDLQNIRKKGKDNIKSKLQDTILNGF